MNTFVIITYFVLILTSSIAINQSIIISLNNLVDDRETTGIDAFLDLVGNLKLANNDTTAPIITFIQPSTNNSQITTSSYNIIVNITDDNPPLPGYVIIQISNTTTWLFNATMSATGGEQWTFNWNNISSYKDLGTYIIQVWAADSSLNATSTWSEAYYVIINLSGGGAPPILNIIIYVLIVVLIIAAIRIYLNRKWDSKMSQKNERTSNSTKD
ncbi:MAG: hypothetical protein ACFFDN_17140 [Candidatus Hodarchaeota archaeon]